MKKKSLSDTQFSFLFANEFQSSSEVDAFIEKSRKKNFSKYWEFCFNENTSFKEFIRSNSQKLNEEFVALQDDLIKRFHYSEEEIIEDSILNKLDLKLPLTENEVSYANANFFLPNGFTFSIDGHLVAT